MNLDFYLSGDLKLTRIPYVNKIVELVTQYSNNSKSTLATPTVEHLFKVNEDADYFTERQMTIYQNFVTKCLVLTKRAPTDVSTDVAFLST